MIEELKGLLDVLAETPQYALWGVAMFIAWKLIVYLSTTGAIVYCVKHITDAIHSARTMPPHPPPPTVTSHTFKIDHICIGDGTEILAALDLFKSEGGYIHRREQRRILRALHDEWNATAPPEEQILGVPDDPPRRP